MRVEVYGVKEIPIVNSLRKMENINQGNDNDG
jgi:hypothetical protein